MNIKDVERSPTLSSVSSEFWELALDNDDEKKTVPQAGLRTTSTGFSDHNTNDSNELSDIESSIGSSMLHKPLEVADQRGYSRVRALLLFWLVAALLILIYLVYFIYLVIDKLK